MTLLLRKISQKNYFQSLIILLFTLLLFLRSVQIPFLNDEISFIKRNHASNLLDYLKLFEKKSYDGFYYRPLANFVSGITTFFFSYDVIYYRLFNLLLHAVSGILLYSFLLNLLKDNRRKKLISLFSALFFIAFPLNDYVVFWQTDLFDRLMLIFYLLGLIAFVKNNFKAGILSMLFFLLSMLSKEMAFSFPLIIALITFYFAKEGKHFRAIISASLPYIILMFAFLLFRIIFLSNNVFTAKDAHSNGTLFIVIKNYFLFSGLLTFPFFIREVQNIFLSHKIFFLATALILFIPVLYYLYKKIKIESILLFFILFTIITIAPASRLFMRWYLYLPETGFAAFASYFLFSAGFKKMTTPFIIALSMLIIYSGAFLHKEADWIKTSDEAVDNLKEFISNNKIEIANSGEINFLTVPAKVNDIPIFNLGFEDLFNFYGKFSKPITVNLYSKSYLNNFDDPIQIVRTSKSLILNQTDDNYFILFNNGKSINFESNNFELETRKNLSINSMELKDKILYTFSNGKFLKLEE